MNVYDLQKLIVAMPDTGRAIINNNNNIITTNNDNIVNCCTPERDKKIIASPLDSSGLLAAPEVATCSGVGNLQNLYQESGLPANWEYVKLDLYNNASVEQLAKNHNKYKIAIHIKKTGHNGWLTFMAGLNSHIRFMKRGLDAETWESTHYNNVKESYAELKQQFGFVRASKTYQKGYAMKGQTTENLSVILAQSNILGQYYINLHYLEQQWLWILRGDAGYLTDAQRRKNMIATAGIKRGNKTKNIRAEDLLS